MKIVLQVAIVFGVCWIGNIISALLPIPFPGSVISMILLFILLLCKVVKVEHIQEKANFMLKNMAMFFIPAGVGIMEQYSAVKGAVLPLLTICLVSTVLTFGATAFTIRGVTALQRKLSKTKDGVSSASQEVTVHE
ncbi:MAG: CidA/LrgA family protein [Massiliimalia sp.]|jgi:holin-like protein